MMIKFEPWHMELIRLSVGNRETATKYGEKLDLLGKSYLAATIVSGDEKPVVLGVVGAIALTPEICEVFVVPSEDRRAHHIEFAKSVRRVLRHIRKQFARIQALGEDTPFYARWFEWLGFSCEGPSANLMMWGMKGERA